MTTSRSELRKRAGLTQLQLARLTGSSAPQICVWERGDRDLPPKIVSRIARVLYDQLTGIPQFQNLDELTRVLEHGK